MKTCRVISWTGILGLVTIAAMSACHTGAPPSPDGQTASVGMAITVPPDFSGVSVFIQGTRTPPANGSHIYGCLSSASDCFTLDPNGFATSTTTGAPGFGGLCPSDDDPVGDWTFTYAFYDDASCGGNGGTQLNDGQHNFVCYAASDIGTRAYPNETYEEVISEGQNENNVLCLTEDAIKTFNFTVCDVLDGDPDAPGPIMLDCGCTPCSIPGMQCLCPGYYGAQPALPTGCSFDSACDIACQ